MDMVLFPFQKIMEHGGTTNGMRNPHNTVQSGILWSQVILLTAHPAIGMNVVVLWQTFFHRQERHLIFF